MSRQAQAERKRQARVILGQAEQQIAESFLQAAQVYRNEPVACSKKQPTNSESAFHRFPPSLARLHS